MALVPVHGGLERPVDRILPLSKKKDLVEESAAMPKVVVQDADLATVYRIADGTLSPLEGPMNEAEVDRVLETRTIERGGTAYAWTIPIVLPVTDEEAQGLATGREAALCDRDLDPIGVLTVESIFDWDKARMVERVYRTSRMDHPGGDIIAKDPRTKLVGGTIQALPAPKNLHFGEYLRTPAETRALLAARKFEAALAFQTRNPLHRAHEYALVYGAEELTRSGLYTGVVLNPLVGQLKGDDVDAATRMRTYAALLKNRALGQGDADEALWKKVGYQLNDVFELIGLDIKMFYGGPSEAVMHAIYRQNHGFSHIVIGRKHADAPYHDKTPIWGDFDAHEIFDDLPGELATRPVKVGFAAFYESLGRVDLMERHPDEKPFFISGTKVREMLQQGEQPDPKIMRPETAAVLIEAYREKSGS
ncbi:MAG TPA: hypothetical protein RMF84_20875 [Polyangiaceae bacterium LLY-WYZ-14_1]|nr:hypothetical protein [Polyangiaceae bacterium LLY-WYZ-14_1]